MAKIVSVSILFFGSLFILFNVFNMYTTGIIQFGFLVIDVILIFLCIANIFYLLHHMNDDIGSVREEKEVLYPQE